MSRRTAQKKGSELIEFDEFFILTLLAEQNGVIYRDNIK